jgi:tRNA-uridine 2-sulfurtransferase
MSTDYNFKKVRALGLSSGGLDSILAAYILKKQNIEVEWITFETPFFSSDKAGKAALFSKIPITVKNITGVYVEMLKKPANGYGREMNPCMDCHALMFRLAGNVMKEKGFDFLFSGEVLGQRPMSQTKSSLRYVEKHSGFEGYILRPLSAGKLPETICEQQGMVDREMLLDISGRSRKEQIELARQFEITDYPSPAGGCLLTEKVYSARLRDMFEHENTCDEKQLNLLKYGRHFRLDQNTKIIVGRTSKDNENIKKYASHDKHILMNVADYPGPVVVTPKNANADILSLAGSICAGYSKAPDKIPVSIKIQTDAGCKTIKVAGMPHQEVRKHMIY